jgi:hypothetical protein
MSVGVMKDYKLKLRNLHAWVCGLEVIGTPSRLRLIRNDAALTMIDDTCDLSIDEKVARRKWKNDPIFDCVDWLNSWTWKKTVSFPMSL